MNITSESVEKGNTLGEVQAALLLAGLAIRRALLDSEGQPMPDEAQMKFILQFKADLRMAANCVVDAQRGVFELMEE